MPKSMQSVSTQTIAYYNIECCHDAQKLEDMGTKKV